jgi:hypothetical protein
MVDLSIRQFDVELSWLADLRVAVTGAGFSEVRCRR